MKVVDIAIENLMPYWHNPRKNDKTVERLMTSIKEYGFNTPLVVNKDMVLITGHARLKAAKKLGLATVPCVVVDLTEEQAKKYRIADNKIQELTEWNEDALFKELREIGNQFDLLDIGFDTAEINEILGSTEELMAEAFPEAEARPVVAEAYPAEPAAETHAEAPAVAAEPKFIEEKRLEKDELEKKLKEREAQLNGRFKQASYEDTRFQNLVVCPHCGQSFKVKGLK